MLLLLGARSGFKRAHRIKEAARCIVPASMKTGVYEWFVKR